MKNFWREIVDLYRYFSNKNSNARKITFYAESAVYYRYFKGYIEYILEHSDCDLCYVSSDPKDPIFQNKNIRIKKFYSSLLFSFIAINTDARALIYSMDDLHQFHIKRSIKPNVNHIYAMHAMSSTTMSHRKSAFDYYDSIFCVGSFQKQEILKREEKYKLHRKNLIEVGYPYLDEVYKNYSAKKEVAIDNNQIFIAPSWHEGNLFETCIIELVKNLLLAGFKVILRPHDETLKRNPKLVFGVQDCFKNEQNFSIELDLRNSKSLLSSSLLISDWSGIIFEWAFAREHPVLFVNTKPKIANKDYMDIGITPIEVQMRECLGKNIDPENIGEIGAYAKHLLTNIDQYIEQIKNIRNNMVYNFGKAAEVGGRYILSTLDIKVESSKKSA